MWHAVAMEVDIILLESDTPVIWRVSACSRVQHGDPPQQHLVVF